MLNVPERAAIESARPSHAGWRLASRGDLVRQGGQPALDRSNGPFQAVRLHRVERGSERGRAKVLAKMAICIRRRPLRRQPDRPAPVSTERAMATSTRTAGRAVVHVGPPLEACR